MATHMSDGCVAMQWSLVPRMAWLRLNPSSAAQPVPGVRLLQRVSARRSGIGLAEVHAARALQQVAAGGGHVAQLRRRA